MKTLLSSKLILSAVVATALTACGGDDDNSTESNNPPIMLGEIMDSEANFTVTGEHASNITITVDEQNLRESGVDPVRAAEIDLLSGIYDTDADDVLSVINFQREIRTGKSVVIDGEPQETWIFDEGIYRRGGRLFVDMKPIAPNLNNDETLSAIYRYEVSDGAASVQRTITINVEGYNNAPEFASAAKAAVSKFTEGGVAEVDLLVGVTDPDLDEDLVVVDLLADAGNTLDGYYSVSGGTLTVDFTKLADDAIADGTILKQYFTYKVQDPAGDQSEIRDLELNLMGVQLIPGAPVFDYFVEKQFNKDSNALVIDLAEGAEDLEGDAIVVSGVQVNGADPSNNFGFEINGRYALLSPLAYVNTVDVGAIEPITVTYNVEDDEGNRADGFRTMTINIFGSEPNLIAAGGVSADFESDTIRGVTETNCPLERGMTDPISGSAYLQLGENCQFILDSSVLPTFASDERYYFTYWLRNDGLPPYIFLDAPDRSILPWTAGRTDYPGDGTWQLQEFYWDFNAGRLADVLAAQDAADVGVLSLFFENQWVTPYGTPSYDDLKLVRVDTLNPLVNDMLKNAGLFEDDSFQPSIDAAIGGTVVRSADATAGVTGFDETHLQEVLGEDFDTFTFPGSTQTLASVVSTSAEGLFIDTSGKTAETVVVQSGLTLPQGAIQTDGRYVFEFDIKHNNSPNDGTAIWFTIRVASASTGESIGKVFSVDNDAFGHQRLMMSEARDSSAADIDWASLDDLVVEIVTPANDAEIYIDNLVLYPIP